jgi:hypothetical protein
MRGEGGGFIPTLNLCVLNPEVQEEVKIAIAIDIHHRELHRSCLSAMFPKTDSVRIKRASVEVGIGENGHGDDPVTTRIDAIRKVTRFDIDEHLRDVGSIQCGSGDGMGDVHAA